MAEGRNCMFCHRELSMCDVDSHPRCVPVPDSGLPPVETEFEKALKRWPADS